MAAAACHFLGFDSLFAEADKHFGHVIAVKWVEQNDVAGTAPQSRYRS